MVVCVTLRSIFSYSKGWGKLLLGSASESVHSGTVEYNHTMPLDDDRLPIHWFPYTSRCVVVPIYEIVTGTVLP